MVLRYSSVGLGPAQIVFQNGWAGNITRVVIAKGTVSLIAQGMGPVNPGYGWVAVVGADDIVVAFAEHQIWNGAQMGELYEYTMNVSTPGETPEPRWTDDGKLVGSIANLGDGLAGT